MDSLSLLEVFGQISSEGPGANPPVGGHEADEFVVFKKFIFKASALYMHL